MSDNGLRFYFLGDDNYVVETADMIEWADRFKLKQVQTEVAGCVVSTVFLGVDHRTPLRGPRPPLVFETMIFGGTLDRRIWRYSSWDDAEIGHQAAVREARRAVTNA
jgi:hypothetical protein